ncbi:MAG: hypothetical protein A3D10_01485 [Omnitrophica WOR_2 bacterium RIFCSPHIGHO2_02_FULL_48_11]|nr:MAG: hypothetical protein A3D10_01485 [Omnitrophica WOR_2 bacterium RIFCSPHIGHO2_02_FULL_48_11]
MISFRSEAKFDKAAIVLLDEQGLKDKRFTFSNKQLKEQTVALLQSGQFTAENGEIFPLVLNKKTVLLVGIGKKEATSLAALRVTVRRAFLSSYLKKAREIELVPHEQAESTIKAIIEAFVIGTYSWKKYLPKGKDDKAGSAVNVAIVSPKKSSYNDALKICEGVNLTRNLINENADTAVSAYIEGVVRNLIKGKKRVSLAVLNRKELKAKGLNLHLAVNKGSNNEPKLMIVKYNGASLKDAYTAVVGKGITFDTGGVNLKPTGSIETMRADMSGTAAVVGILKNTLALNLKKNILFVFGIAENVIGSQAYKPGDVFRSYSGKTVEIGNTDAEGRLVLADAISYVARNYKPKKIIDIATLTGACVIALGYDYSGLVASDDDFARQLIRSSNETDDRAWRLPSYAELEDYIKSPIADLKNVGLPKGAGGTITAAEFLRQFTEGIPWAHLDIAGTAFVDNGAGRMYYSYGATGAGVRLLTHYLKNS